MTEPTADVPEPALAVADLARELETPDTDAEWGVRKALRASGYHPGQLGQLEDLAAWLAGCQRQAPPREPTRARLIIFAGDHGIRAAGVSAYPDADTSAAVRALREGSAAICPLAALADVGLRVVDAGGAGPDDDPDRVRAGSGRIDVEDGLSAAEVSAALALGARVADEEIDAGADLLLVGDVGIGSTTVAAVLISLLTNSEPVRVVGRSAGIDDQTWMAKVTAIRDARHRAAGRRFDLDDLLAALGGADVVALCGFLLRSATRRTPTILDGVVTVAAALVAREVNPRGQRWWRAALRTAEPADELALARLHLDPITVGGPEFGQGAGALVAVGTIRAAARFVAALPVAVDTQQTAEAPEAVGVVDAT